MSLINRSSDEHSCTALDGCVLGEIGGPIDETKQACHVARLFSFQYLAADRRADGLVLFRDRRTDLNRTGLQPLGYLTLEIDRQ